MQRHVSVHLEVSVTEPALIALQVAVATPTGADGLIASIDGEAIGARQVEGPHGGWIHLIQAHAGYLIVDYTEDFVGALPVPPSSDHDLLMYRRPSRYCPSDRFMATSAAEFGEITDTGQFATAVAAWVQRRLIYIGGSSSPTDDAVDTMLLGEGVCRDYAHLVTSLLRARDVPARVVAVYAPGLSPMDFHAVVEVWFEDAWHIVDATGLAPRASMLRIATGRDASDTAFMSVHDGKADLEVVNVSAVVDTLPQEDYSQHMVLI